MTRLILFALTLAVPSLAAAQAHPGSLEISGGFVWTGGYGAGSAPANETRNPSTGSTPLTLFQSESHVSAAPGANLRLGVHVTRRLVAEAFFEYTRPVLRALLTADFEGAASATAEMTASSYLFGGSAVYEFGAGRVMPFVAGGGGQLRQVPEGGNVTTGGEGHASAGVRYAITNGHHPLGMRLEAGVSSRSKSAGFTQQGRTLIIANAGLAWRF
jgi:Outer membrane protein beta-barrel domain